MPSFILLAYFLISDGIQLFSGILWGRITISWPWPEETSLNRTAARKKSESWNLFLLR